MTTRLEAGTITEVNIRSTVDFRHLKRCAAIIAYGALASLLAKYLGDGAEDFWWALGILVVVRLVFWMIELGADSIVWRLEEREQLVAMFLGRMRRATLPPRLASTDDVATYLCRIEELNEAWWITPQMAEVARSMRETLEGAERFGLLWEKRTEDALERALEQYSPRANAPQSLQKPLSQRINEADAEYLAALPGLPSQVAKDLVDRRPFGSNAEAYSWITEKGVSPEDARRFLTAASQVSDRQRVLA